MPSPPPLTSRVNHEKQVTLPCARHMLLSVPQPFPGSQSISEAAGIPLQRPLGATPAGPATSLWVCGLWPFAPPPWETAAIQHGHGTAQDTFYNLLSPLAHAPLFILLFPLMLFCFDRGGLPSPLLPPRASLSPRPLLSSTG